MTPYLLALSIGPVQDFIAAARRTRDLWYGSTLLSDLSKAVARHLKDLKEQGVTLIFPHPDADLNNTDTNIANQIIVKVTAVDTEAVRLIAETAKDAAWKCWREQAKNVLSKDDLKELVNPAIWDSQINDVLELYAAWVPLPDNKSYLKQRQRLMALLSARKNTRDFRPGQGFPGVPKSLLDGARESVLPVGQLSDEQLKICREEGIKIVEIDSQSVPKKYRCEPLDVAGVVKRVLGSKQDYPSVARVAVDPWLRQLKASEIDEIKKEIDVIRKTYGKWIISPIKDSIVQYKTFPFEGTSLYINRHQDIARQADIIAETNSDKKFFPKLQKKLCDLYDEKKYGEPSPYLAVLCADGDKIGEALGKMDLLKQHHEFSEQLSSFAAKARKIIEEHHGVCVYTGGDDVLAFLPLDMCLDAAGELHTCFEETLKKFSAAGKSPTLSVGIAIGHFMEELSQLRQWGKEAEKLAKGKNTERDGLAVVLHTRGGGDFELRAAWSTSPDRQLWQWIEAFQTGKLPHTLPYDLHQLLDLYRHHTDPLMADMRRMLKVKGIRDEYFSGKIDQLSTYNQLEQLTRMLLLAARLASHLPPKESLDEKIV